MPDFTLDAPAGRPSPARQAAACFALLAALALAACAPDAILRDREFEAWFAQVRETCGSARIGLTTIDSLMRLAGTTDGKNFMNATSRLYAGRITEAQWTSQVTAFSSGRATDPGVQCVLERLAAR